MCLGTVSATLEKEWKVNVPFCSLSIPTSARKWRTQDWQKRPGWSPVEMTLPGKRPSDLPFSQVRSARISLLSGGVENSTLSLEALWRSHLSGRDCSSHTLWTRAWRLSLTCDQHPIRESSRGKLLFGRGLGEFSYKAMCSWGRALARPPMNRNVVLLLPRGWDLAPGKEHTHASEAWHCCSVQLHGSWNFTDAGEARGGWPSAAFIFICCSVRVFLCPLTRQPFKNVVPCGSH